MADKCPAGEVYNIGGQRTMAVGKMLDVLLGMTDVKVKVKVEPKLLRPSDVTLQIPDTSKFQKATGWKPAIPLEKTLEDLLNYWREKIVRQYVYHA